MSKVIVSPKELKAKQSNKNMVIIDLRSSETYEITHFENAINLEAKKYFAEENAYLPNLTTLGNVLGEKEISHTSKDIFTENGRWRSADELKKHFKNLDK